MDSRGIQKTLAKNDQYVVLEEVDLQIAADRNKDIQQIHADVEEIQSLTSDISLLVMAQGEDLNQAEDHVTKAADNTRLGAALLEEANDYQDKRRKRTAAIIFTIFTIGASLGGGAALRGVIGIQGTVGLLAGAAIVLAGIALLAGIAYSIFSLIQCCRPKAAHRAPEPEERKEHRKTSSNDLTHDFFETNTTGFGLSGSLPGFMFEGRQNKQGGSEGTGITNTAVHTPPSLTKRGSCQLN